MAVGVEEAGTHGSFGYFDDFGDFSVGQALDIKHGHHGSMVIGQFLQGFVQMPLEFVQSRVGRKAEFTDWAAELIAVVAAAGVLRWLQLRGGQ